MTRRAGWLIACILGSFLSSGASPVQAQAATIILVRHAEKAAPSGDPELTPTGEQRARDLVKALAAVPLTAVITTQFKRTQLTGAPVARSAGLEPIIVPATRDAAADMAGIIRVLDSLPSGSSALIVGHSNTLASIIAALGGPRIPDLCDGEHSTLFILTRPGPPQAVGLVRARYGAPEPQEASEC